MSWNPSGARSTNETLETPGGTGTGSRRAGRTVRANARRAADRVDSSSVTPPRVSRRWVGGGGTPVPFGDDFAHCEMEKAEEIRGLFVPHFYFGCEADDPRTAFAFNSRANPCGARLRPVLSSDIGHWDVIDMRNVLAEAYEMVEKEALTEDDFRDFVFTNAVTLYAETNPDFFKGTVCEGAVEKLLRQGS